MAAKSKKTEAATANAPKEYNLEQNSPLSQTPEQIAAAQSLALAIAGPVNSSLDLSKFKRKGMPTMVKPEQLPIGSIVQAEIVEVLPSPVSTIKGFLLHLKGIPSGTEFTFPCTGVVRNALAPGVRDDDTKLKAALDKYAGKEIVLKRLPNKPSKFKKEMFCFDVFIAE